MDTMIIALYCRCDDWIGALHPQEAGSTSRMSDAEVVTAALVAAVYFAGHHDHARLVLQEQGYIPTMLSKSRFNRRLHQLYPLLEQLFEGWREVGKQANRSQLYAVDSFPLAVCDNKRIPRSRRYQGEQWRGYPASKRRYFYGVKVHLLVTEQGLPVECLVTAGSMHDAKAFPHLRLDLPVGSKIVADKAYNHYALEDELAQVGIALSPLRKANSKRPVLPYVTYWRQLKRKVVETTGSLLERLLPKHIHSVTADGFELKLLTFLFAITVTALLA
ncbi:MAG: IS982 family transposase [Thiolinea sp.]